MLNSTQKRVEHGRERQVGDGRRGKQGEEKWEKYQPTWTACESFLLILAWLPMSGNV